MQRLPYVPGCVLAGFFLAWSGQPISHLSWLMAGLATAASLLLAWVLELRLRSAPPTGLAIGPILEGLGDVLFVSIGALASMAGEALNNRGNLADFRDQAALVSPQLLWVWISAIYLGSYIAATGLVSQRAKVNRSPGLVQRRVGSLAWAPAIVAGAGMGLVVVAFWRQGLTTSGTWLTLWLIVWLVSRTLYFSNAVRNWSNPDWIDQVAGQMLRGGVLLQGAVLTSLLPPLPGLAAFAIVFVLFPLTSLAQRKSTRNSQCK